MANPFSAHNEQVVETLTQNPDLIQSKEWRLNNLYWIVTKDGKKEVFKMNKAQKHFFYNYLNIPQPYHRHVILKSRQLGFTTFIDIFILDEILFKTNKDAIVIAHKLEDATSIFDKKVDFAVRNMAEDVKGAFFKIHRNTARKIQVTIDYGPETGSTSSITVSTSGRSGTYHYVHISEFAKLCVMFPRRAEEVETGTFPTVPFDGFIFIESTAEGMAGRFYEMFQENWINREKISAQLSQVQFKPHFYNWQYDDMEMKKIHTPIPVSQMEVCEIPWAEYQKEHNLTDIEITYYYMKWLQLGGRSGVDAIKKLKQEYPTTPEEAFLSTGQSYFPTAKVASLLANAKKGTKGELFTNEKGEVVFQEISSGNLEIFEKPERGTRYVIGGDTAEGLAHGDAQVLYVINHKTEECVALYRSQVAPDELATEAYKLGKFFNYALLGIEVNKDGLWVNDALEKMGYLNLYYRKSFDDITQKMTKYFGWKTTSATRPFALASLKAIFVRKNQGFPAALLGEMLTFVRNERGKAEALNGKHDDCFVKDTLILTDKGNIPIQNIKIGDLVMTRDGLKPVIMTRNKIKKVISNIGLKGTPDHPVILADNSEKPLAKVEQYDTLHIWNQQTKQIEKLSYIKAKNIIETQTQQGDSIRLISGGMINGKNHRFLYIGKFGWIILEKFLKATQYTIKTVILLITVFQILKYYLQKIMQKSICKIEKKKKELSVSFVKKNLFTLLSQKLNGVVKVVEQKQGELVYNLQIDGKPEYFANNILVHNCIMAASIAYAILQEQGKFQEETQTEANFSHLKVLFGEQ